MSKRPVTLHYIILSVLITCLSAAESVFAQGRRSTPFLFSQDLSSPYVTAFAEDPKGFIWIGTNHGLNRYNGSFYDVHYTYSYDETMNNDNVMKLMTDEAGDLWLLTEAGLSVRRNSQFYHYGQAGFAPIWQIADLDKDYLVIADNRGVDKINKKDLTLAYHYKSLKVGIPKPIGVSGNGCVLMTREGEGTDLVVILDDQMREIGALNFPTPAIVSKIIRDRDGSNWIVTNKSIYHILPEDLLNPNETHNAQVLITLDKTLLDLYSAIGVLFVEDYDEQNLIIGLQKTGLFLIDKKSGKMSPIHSSELLPKDSYVCFVDSNHNIWLSDGNNGFTLLPPDIGYEHLSFPGSNDPNFKKLCFDQGNRLWIRSAEDLICYDPETRNYHSFTEPNTFYGDIFVDSKNRLWTIEKYTHLKCYNIAEDANNPVGVKLSLAKQFELNESVFSLCEDAEGRIWSALADRFAVIGNDGSITYSEGPFKVNFTSLQSHGKSGRMFLYTVGNTIYEYSAEERFQPIGTQVSGTRIVYADSRKNLWIGSSNRGLVRYDEQTHETEFLQEKMEIGAHDIKAIEEDYSGNIWFSTSTMLFRYSPQDGSVISIHDDQLKNGIVYNLYASASDKQGRLYFSGMNGISVVDPIGVKYKKQMVPIKVEDIVISGTNLFEYDGKPFELNYNENNIVFWFSGLNFSLGSQLSYEYRLDGYDKDGLWLPVGHQTRISFSDLPAGKYNLRIRVKSQYGSATLGDGSVPFTINPALWFTIWAKLLYIIIFIILAFFGFRHLIRWRLREERYALLQQREAVNSEFVRFVTNISHEFRTPLSMMYAPLVEFLSGKTFEGKDRDLLDMVMRNTERLKTLTEKVLIAGKGHSKEKKLHICPQNITPFLKVTFENFNYLAYEKNITMEFAVKEEVQCPIDNEKVDRIISNLLSNSLKYTPDGGKVTMSVSKSEGLVNVSVVDTGMGVPEERAKNLFTKYDRLGMETNNPNIEGTGIGLYYSAYLARLHKGSLSYKPNAPKGSCFTLSLPEDVNTYSAEQIISEEKVFQTTNAISVTEDVQKNTKAEGSLFIVEDNQDVCHFLQLCLGKKYKLFVSNNGAEALDNLSTCVPDLIISDVMMPVMNGHELCQKLKSSSTYGHIPIILLTAVDDDKHAVEYIKSGADAYLQKPFDPRKLVAMIESMIANRRRIQNMVSSLTSSTLATNTITESEHGETTDMLSTADRNFLEKFYAKLDEHLADENYGIDEMGKSLGIGEAKLYAKVKTLTGQTPKAFFVTYRMNKAMELLKSGQYTVSEVGYMVGATSPAVFSRSFKHQFGVAPSAVSE